MTQEDELVEIKYTYARLQTIKRKYPKIFEELKDKTGKKYRFSKIKVNENTTEYLISNLSNEEIRYKRRSNCKNMICFFLILHKQEPIKQNPNKIYKKKREE